MKYVTDKIETYMRLLRLLIYDFRGVKAQGTDQPAITEEISTKCEVYCTTSV